MQRFSFLNSTLLVLCLLSVCAIMYTIRTHTHTLMQITKMKTFQTVRCCDCCFNGSIVDTVKSWKCTTDFHKLSHILYQSLVHFLFLSLSLAKYLFCSFSIHFIKLEIAYIERKKKKFVDLLSSILCSKTDWANRNQFEMFQLLQGTILCGENTRPNCFNHTRFARTRTYNFSFVAI